jgi:nucleoside-diphosphate-sugar epimerase
VFDFAGVSGAVESNDNPLRSLEEDCRPHLSLFQACAEAQEPPLVVFCSSRLVYGKPQYLPVDESHPLAPQSMYAAHKITAENYLRVFGHTHGLRSCILRLSNPYGPHQPQVARSYSVLNQFIRAASEGVPIKIYGNGCQQRDYIYIDDVITAFLLCAIHEKCYGQTFNLGGRDSISIKTAVERIAWLAGGTPVHFEPWPQDYKAVETGNYRTDLRKIDSYLALPPPTPFEEGLSRTLDFYRKEHSALQAKQP